MNRDLALKTSVVANVGIILLATLFTARPNLNAHANAIGRGFNKNAVQHQDKTLMHSKELRHFCDESHAGYLAALSAFAKVQLSLNADQTELLNRLTDTLRTSTVKSFEPVCADSSLENLTALERLDRVQTTLEASSGTLAQVRPSFDAFYTTLDENQQQKLDRLLSQWHQPRHESEEER